MTKECAHSSKPTMFSVSVLAIWFVPAILLIVGAFMSYGSLPYIPWICVGLAALIVIVFIAWIPREYEILDDRIRIKCNSMKTEFHFKDIESVGKKLSSRKLISAALMDKTVFMTSFKNSIYIELKGKLTKSTQVSPVDHGVFLETLQSCLNEYRAKEA